MQINLPSALGLASVQLVALGAFVLLPPSLVVAIGICLILVATSPEIGTIAPQLKNSLVSRL